MNHLIFARKAYIPNFRPLVPFLPVKKFVVVGGWVVGVKTWILVLSCKPKLNNLSTSLTKSIPRDSRIKRSDLDRVQHHPWSFFFHPTRPCKRTLSFSRVCLALFTLFTKYIFLHLIMFTDLFLDILYFELGVPNGAPNRPWKANLRTPKVKKGL